MKKFLVIFSFFALNVFSQNPWIDLYYPFLNGSYLQQHKVKSVLLVRVDPNSGQQERIEKFDVDQNGNVVSYLSVTTSEKRDFYYNPNTKLIDKQVYNSGNNVDTIFYFVDANSKKIYELTFYPASDGFHYQLFEYSYSFTGMLIDIKKATGKVREKFSIQNIPETVHPVSCFVLHNNGFSVKLNENEQITLTMYPDRLNSLEFTHPDHPETWNFEYDVITKKLVMIEVLAEDRKFKIFVTYETW